MIEAGFRRLSMIAALALGTPAVADPIKLGWLPDSAGKMGHGVNVYDVAEWSLEPCVEGKLSAPEASGDKVDFYFVKGQKTIDAALNVDVGGEASGWGAKVTARTKQTHRLEAKSDNISLLIVYRKSFGTRRLTGVDLVPDAKLLMNSGQFRMNGSGGYGFVDLCKSGVVIAERKESAAMVLLEWQNNFSSTTDRDEVSADLDAGGVVKLDGEHIRQVTMKLAEQKATLQASIEGVSSDGPALQEVTISLAGLTADADITAATSALMIGFANSLSHISEDRAHVAEREVWSYDDVVRRLIPEIPFPSHGGRYADGLLEIYDNLDIVSEARKIQGALRKNPKLGWSYSGVQEFSTKVQDRAPLRGMLDYGDKLLDSYEAILIGFADRCSSIGGQGANLHYPNLQKVFGSGYAGLSLEDLFFYGSLKEFNSERAKADIEPVEPVVAPEDGLDEQGEPKKTYNISFFAKNYGAAGTLIPELSTAYSVQGQVGEIPLTFKYERLSSDFESAEFCQAPTMKPAHLPLSIDKIDDPRGYIFYADEIVGKSVLTFWNWPAWLEALGVGYRQQRTLEEMASHPNKEVKPLWAMD